jgi:choice-of-anchor C domain-containing protein
MKRYSTAGGKGRFKLGFFAAAALTVAGSMLAPPRASAANLLVNGSFETYAKSTSAWTIPNNVDWNLPAGDTQITGWTVTRGPIDFYSDNVIPNGGWKAADGKYSLDLGGTPGIGGVSQAFATQVGASYLLTFSLSGNPDAGPSLKTLTATVGSTSANFSYDISAQGNSDGNMKWIQVSMPFVATGTTTTLEIYNTMALTNAGPALDNVSVIQTPEPAALSILGGGAACMLLRGRRRSGAR